MTTPQKPERSATAIVGSVGRRPLPFRESFRFRETVPVGLPRTPRPPGRGFSCVPCRSVVAVPSRDVLRVYGATRKCPRRPATNMEVGRFPGPQGSGTSGKPQWLPTGASGQESKPGSRAEYQGWFKARGIRGLTPACWRFFVCGAGTAAERAVLSRDVAARHRSGRLLRSRDLDQAWLHRFGVKRQRRALRPARVPERGNLCRLRWRFEAWRHRGAADPGKQKPALRRASFEHEALDRRAPRHDASAVALVRGPLHHLILPSL